jgi:hypothetical protein
MSTSTTLRLAGLAAAIAVSLSITSSALAKPAGVKPSDSGMAGPAAVATTGAITVAGVKPSDSGMGAPASVITIRLHRSGQLVGPADSPGDVGSPVIPLQAVRADNPADVGTPSIQAPMVRVDNPADIGTPSVGLLPAVSAPAASSGFNWQDATLGALVGLALACIAAFAMGTIRGRRDLALR